LEVRRKETGFGKQRRESGKRTTVKKKAGPQPGRPKTPRSRRTSGGNSQLEGEVGKKKRKAKKDYFVNREK